MQLFVAAKGAVHFQGKILLIRESTSYVDGSGAGKWDMVGGRIEETETVHEGLVREVLEESGLNVAPGELLGVFDGFPTIKGEKSHVVRLYFLCAASNDKVILSEDHDEYRWVDPRSYTDLVFMNDIEEMLKEVADRLDK